jgi:hypothetical protein
LRVNYGAWTLIGSCMIWLTSRARVSIGVEL